MKQPAKYLVWIRGVGGSPCPQVWYEDLRDGSGRYQNKSVGGPSGLLLAFHHINPMHTHLDLKVLADLYPYEENDDE